MTTNDKISALRQAMVSQNISAVIIPSSDPHQSEYSTKRFSLREWISGFTGSAGTVLVTTDHAGLWADARYFIQAESELADSEVQLHKLLVQTAPEWVQWIAETLPSGSRVGIDGKVFSLGAAQAIKSILSPKGIELVVDFDPAKVWQDRPKMPLSPVYVHDVHTAGLSARDKIGKVREFLTANASNAILFEALDEIAYLLNIRGADIAYNPVTYAYLTITNKSTTLFIDERKLNSEVKNYLRSAGVDVRPYEDIETWLKNEQKKSLCVDPAKFSAYHHSLVPKDIEIIQATSPAVMLKCIKNASEIAGTHRAMLKDAVALVEFYRTVEQEAEKLGYDEADLAELIGKIRSKQEGYVSESFGAIVGFKENGAIVHYRPEKPQAKKIQGSGMILIDTGGQYKDGTTDITRVWYLGTPTQEEKKAYTLVLKAHIGIERLVFPQGYSGTQLDAVARHHMWAEGYNYGHGTGHGVGAFMNVHEGPISFGNRGVTIGTAFEPGMIISDEPGYYKAGAFGIRIENCVLVRPVMENENGSFYGFEALTLAPIETKLIDITMMSDCELEWLNSYHAHVLDKVLPLVESEDATWLMGKCKPLYR